MYSNKNTDMAHVLNTGWMNTPQKYVWLQVFLCFINRFLQSNECITQIVVTVSKKTWCHQSISMPIVEELDLLIFLLKLQTSKQVLKPQISIGWVSR